MRRFPDGLVLTGFAASLLACRPAPPVQAAFDAGETDGAAAPHAAGAAGASAGSGETDPAVLEKRARMHEHFVAISGIRDAVLVGDLDTARSRAADLHGKPPADDPGWAPHTRAVVEAAGRVSGSGDLPAAANATASLALQCGNCHGALEVSIDLPIPEAPRTAKTVEASMEVHRWAAQRMWEGIVFPSEERWIRGTSMFVALPGCGEVHPDSNTPVSDSDPKCQAVQRVVRQAYDPKDSLQRASAYGKLLVTCANCHAPGA